MAPLGLAHPTVANLVHLQTSPQFATLNARLAMCSTRLLGCGHRIPHLGKALLNLPRRPLFKVTFCTARSVEEMEQDHSKEKAIGVSEKDGDTLFGKVKSDTYSANMTHAMGAVLTYRHELGMNYNFVRPDLIVGSCLQSPSDVDRLRNIGVKTIFCLQQDPDLEYFGVDICAIQEHAKAIEGIEHIRAAIRDFDPFDLRVRLPAVIAKLDEAVQRNKGVTYIHCTAGLGRAPAVALTYMYWLLGYKLHEANKILQNVRPCFPKLESIRNATCDILTGQTKETIVLQWKHGNCEIVEISGLDVGWGQRLPLAYFPKEQCWMLSRQLPVGRYEYKYIIDGAWTHNPDEGVTESNNGGHINNFVEVIGDSADDETRALRQRLMRDDVGLSDLECQTIRRRLKDLV